MSEREIEIEIGEGWWAALLPLILLGVIGLAILGRQLTPEAGSVLTPAAWRLMKAERAYEEELGLLREDFEELVRMFNANPNPVEAGLAADRIQYETLDGHPALSLQREVVAYASEIVWNWAMGGTTREDAEVVLTEAILMLEREH
jgi:hypothetical protein